MVLGVLLGLAQGVQAIAIAESDLSFFGLQISPASGTLELLSPWELETFAQAQNSLGELSDEFVSATGPAAIQANAQVTYAEGQGRAAALGDPPDLDVTADAASEANIPAATTAQAASLGRGAFFNFFQITGGVGPVQVDFSGQLTGMLQVMTDQFGQLAETETIFALEVDGFPVLFFQDLLSIGPNDADSRPVSETLFGSLTLAFDTPYFLFAEADSESQAINVAEPGTLALLLPGLGLLAMRGVKKSAHARRRGPIRPSDGQPR